MAELTRREVEGRLIARALADEKYRAQLLQDPKAEIEKELGQPLPANVVVKAIEETDTTFYLVLPAAPAQQLSAEDLEVVAGGAARDYRLDSKR